MRIYEDETSFYTMKKKIISLGLIVLMSFGFWSIICEGQSKPFIPNESKISNKTAEVNIQYEKSLKFQSINFKLVVINELLKQGYFKKEIQELKSKYWKWDDYSYKPIPEILAYCQSLQISQKHLNKIKELTFDGGNEIYLILIPNWDGEDRQFDVTDISDISSLKNLCEIYAISMLYVNDFNPLLKVKRLEKIHYWDDLENSTIGEQLEARGVSFK